MCAVTLCLCFFFPETAPTEIYTLSLHDALPICTPDTDPRHVVHVDRQVERHRLRGRRQQGNGDGADRSEEHTSELQSRRDLVCRLLLEKKKTLPHTTPPCRNTLHARFSLHLTTS